MAVSAYTYRLPANVPAINGADTVVIMADSAANALALLRSHYPNVPLGIWSALTPPSAEAGSASYNGYKTTVTVTPIATGRTAVSGRTYTFSYTSATAQTADQVATALAAVMAASEPFSGTTNAGSGVITLAAVDEVGDAVVTAKVEYVADMAAYDAITNPQALNNLQAIPKLAPTVQAAQAHGATRTVTLIAITDAPRVVGWFKDMTGASR
jgi:hypothetical protein